MRLINSSKWFRICFFAAFWIYILFWFYTIYLQNLQKEKDIMPLMPVVAQDSEGYYNLTESLIKGEGFSQNGKPETLRTPAYPIFAATIKYIFGSYFAVTLAQIFLVFSSALIIRKIGIFFYSQKAGEIAALLFLINPVTLSLSLVVMTDTFFVFLFVLGVYLTLYLGNQKLYLKVLIVSLVFVAAVYTRLGVFAAPIFLAPILTLKINWKSKLKFAIAVAALILLSTTPWIYRNYEKVGIAGFTSFRSQNLGWAATHFLSAENRTDWGQEFQNFLDKIEIKSSDYYDIRFSDKIGKGAQEIILARPFSYFRYHLVSSIPFLFPSTILYASDTYRGAIGERNNEPARPGAISSLVAGNVYEFLSGIMKSWWKVLERLLWLAAYLLAVFGIWKNKKEFWPWVLAFTVLYIMILAGPASGPRYTFPAFPAMFLLFSLGGATLFNEIKKTD